MSKIAVRLKNPSNKFYSEDGKTYITGPDIHSLEENKHVKKALSIHLLERVPDSDLPKEVSEVPSKQPDSKKNQS